MLFLGLFRIARAGRLRDLFQSKKGFKHFMVICTVIAIFAIWADFNALNELNLTQIYLYSWQIEYNTVHTYLRDIGLLLVPIAVLLFWCLRRVSCESPRQTATRDAGTQRSSALE